ncbi:hypothetical protein [Devosia aurantiaca]|uniref:Uncharacterized protein n=1 Tax=Devosia aurantiaca TaxID=2714858 RepID=A0A6M1SM75_9HYPH|nr:hypothetical protein [Devosia aurantiaca]NGP18220.1 hypothetical protein [Devosia aurantiaca]
MSSLNLPTYYQSLNDNAAAILGALAKDQESLARQIASHNFLADFPALVSAIRSRPESNMLSLAEKEYQYALYAIATGSYRHAFASLRLAMELALSSILFSAHEIRYHQWSAGDADINWNSIVEDEGIFSKNFIKAFFPDLADQGTQYRAIAKAAYRECSQYVHGNMKTHSDVGLEVRFRKEVFMAWHDLAETFHLCLVFAFAARFALGLDKSQLSDIRHILTENIGQLTGIQSLNT